MNLTFFTASALPELHVRVKPEMSFHGFMQLCHDSLTAHSMEVLGTIQEYIDVVNIKRLLKKTPIDNRGRLSEKELDDALVSLEGLPEVVIEYLRTYESEEERIQYFARCLSSYLEWRSEHSKGFVRRYFAHEKMVRLALVAFRCARQGLDVVEQLSFEDPKDPFIASLLVQKDVGQFTFPYEIESLGEYMEKAHSPVDEYKALMEYMMSFAKKEGMQDVFSLDYIASYMVQLLALENWDAMDAQTGTGIIEGMV